MLIDQVLKIVDFFQISVLAKLIILVGGMFFFVLGVIIYRQIILMTQSLDSSISPEIKGVALVQIFVLAFLFFLAVFLV